LVFSKTLDRLASAGGLGHDPHVRLAVDYGRNPFSYDRMVIHTEDTDVLSEYPHFFPIPTIHCVSQCESVVLMTGCFLTNEHGLLHP
jgi:hypothetical protein